LVGIVGPLIDPDEEEIGLCVTQQNFHFGSFLMPPSCLLEH
jgi:hypothetical protein